jgi:hypothetical protein
MVPREAPKAWLGVDLARPDPSLVAHVPTLPPGMGFVVRAIREDGPAGDAGIREMDLLWKLDDQMLVNEAQLAALLRLHKPGDEVRLTLVRGGREMVVAMNLGEAPGLRGDIARQAVEAAMFPGETGPIRVVNVAAKQATYNTDEGRAVVSRDGDVYHVVIHGTNDEVIFDGKLTKDKGLSKVPEGWRRKVCALRRGLDHALEGRMPASRQPRPRVVPPASARP